jgi:AraC-like DNA-binding protein
MYYGRIIYPEDSIYTGREHINLAFVHQGVNITLSCCLLDRGKTIRNSRMCFSHPHPPFSRFFIFYEGRAEVKTFDGKYTLTPGNIYHLPPNQSFEIVYEKSKMIFFHLNLVDISGQSIFSDAKGIPCITDSSIYERFLYGLRNDNMLATITAITDTLCEFLLPLLNDVAVQARRIKYFSSIFDYLQKGKIARVSIPELSELYSKTPNALSKHFSRVMGVSLKKYLLQRQLFQAQDMLLHSSKTIAQIAEELGHTNPQYFHRLFKKHCYCTPSEYRNLNRSTNPRA